MNLMWIVILPWKQYCMRVSKFWRVMLGGKNVCVCVSMCIYILQISHLCFTKHILLMYYVIYCLREKEGFIICPANKIWKHQQYTKQKPQSFVISLLKITVDVNKIVSIWFCLLLHFGLAYFDFRYQIL